MEAFKYKEIQLYKNERLGAGTYGMVCKARCDKLECAAKLLHPRHFDANEATSVQNLSKFRQECEILEKLRSPYVIQYLGTWVDPESGLPVLLMELMDENLTTFLDQYQGQLLYNIQVDICSDVAQALAYLHSNGIIHRDLSSNNVLIFAGRRAKVSDFGMSKLTQNESSNVSHTMLPGSDPYMPPEAKLTHYTEKLDSFSFGVLTLQILTRKCPKPGPLMTPPDRAHPYGQPISEIKRRSEHISLVPPSHALLKISLSCMQNLEKSRPSAQELCTEIEKQKLTTDYKQFEDQYRLRITSVVRREKVIVCLFVCLCVLTGLFNMRVLFHNVEWDTVEAD